MFRPHRSRRAFVLVAAGLLVAGVAILLAVRPPRRGTAPQAISGSRIRAHIAFLADDLLEGREAGTRGFDIAARYAAAQLALAGLAPAADDGSYFQPVALRRSTVTASTVDAVPVGRAPIALPVPGEAIVVPNSRLPHVDVSAPVVYVGYGVTAPDLHHDDYAGLDVTGKFVLLLYNAPASFPSELKAYYASPPQKLKMAADHGAAGVLVAFAPPDRQQLPWARLQGYVRQPAITTVLPDGTPVMAEPRIPALAYLSEQGASRLFAGAGFTANEAYQAAAEGHSRGAVLPMTVRVTVSSQYEQAASENVVGRLEGGDPALSGTSVVLTAHLDHLGIDPARSGDRIFNGAYDNAAGSAILLEVARAFGGAPVRPRRSVIVALVTAEEKGLLGSAYLARYPVKAAGRTVANVNLDMPVFMTAAGDVVAFGSENSTLGALVRRAAVAEGFTLSPDPMPEQNIFVRSDQYSFVKQGIPSVYLMPGFTAVDPKVNGRAVFESFLEKRYHQVGDDLSLPFDEAAAARFADLNYRIARAIADDPVAPAWKKGNFFGRMFGPVKAD
jgi:Peptidase family M28